MDFHGYYTGDPNNWYQSRSVPRESAVEYGGNYHGSHFYDYSHHHQFHNPHLWMNPPNPIPSNPSFYHHTSYSPPPLPNHTIINGHSLPLQFPFSSQISQPMNHQPSQPICYPQSQPYNSYVCLPTPQFQAQSTEIRPTKATTTPPIYQPSPHVPQPELIKPTETNPIDQVTYTQFSYASLQLEDTKVTGSADKSSRHNEYTTESGQNLGVSATPLNMEPYLKMPDHETNGGIDDKSVCGLIPSLAFTTSKGQANIVLDKAVNSIKDGAQGVCENAAEDSEAINLHLSCKVTSVVLDKTSLWDYLGRNGYKMLVNTNHDNCTKPPDIFHRYDYLHDIAIEAYCKEEFLHVFIALVSDCSKLYLFEARRDFLWNMLEPNFAAMIISYSPLVNVNLGKANLPTGDRIEELQQNVGMLFERMWEHWKLKLKTETSLVDIGDMELDIKLLLHDFEQLIHCCNRTVSVHKDHVLTNNSYAIQFHMVASVILALTALPLLLLIQKVLSSLDELLYDILFGSRYNVLQFDRLVQTAIQNSKLSNVLTQGQADMRLLVANFDFELFTWLNGQLRLELPSLVHDSLVWKCMKTITHYCSHIIVGIQVGSRLHFLQITRFWFNGDQHRNVLQRFMEFEIMILVKKITIELIVRHNAVVKNHQPYLPTLWSVEYQIVCSSLPTLVAWLNDTLLCAPLVNKWEKLILLIAGWFKKMEGSVNFFEDYIEPDEKCLGSVMLGVGVNVSIWDVLQLFDEMQKWGLFLIVSVFGSSHNNNKYDGNQRDFNELWSYVFFVRFPQLQVTAKVGRSVVTLLMMFAISSLTAKESYMLVTERLLRNTVYMLNLMFEVLRYMKRLDFLQTHLLMGNSHIGLNELLGKLRSKPNPQKLFDVFSAYASVCVVEEAITSLELMRSESQINPVDFKALMAHAIILFHLIEVVELNKGMANLLRAFGIYTACNHLANYPPSNGPQVSIEHFVDIVFIVPLHEAIMGHWFGAYDEESNWQGTKRNNGRLINLFGSHHFFTNKMLQHYTCLQLIMRKLIWAEFQVGLAGILESTDISTRPVKMFNEEWGHFTATCNLDNITVNLEPARSCYQIRNTFTNVNMGKFHLSQEKLSVHEATKMIKLVDKEDGSFHYCCRWGIMTSVIFYFGFVPSLSIYWCFWYDILGAAFDNRMTLKLLSIVDSAHGTSLKTLGMSLPGMRTCLMLRGQDC